MRRFEATPLEDKYYISLFVCFRENVYLCGKNNVKMAHQIVIDVEDGSILPSLRQILTHIKGVSVRAQKETQKEAPLSAYEESLEDLREGRTNTYQSAEHFFEKMGI